MIAIADSLLCLACLWFARSEVFRLETGTRHPPRYPVLWGALALVLGLLALQETTGMLGAITNTARHEAITEGWYGERRPFQWILIKTVPVVAALAGLGALWVIRNSRQRYFPVVVATLYWVSYAVIQGISFHNVDWLLRQRSVGLQNKTWGDLAGMALTVAALLSAWCSDRLRPTAPVHGRGVLSVPPTPGWLGRVTQLGRAAGQSLHDEGRIFRGWYLRFRDHRRRRGVSGRKR